MIPNTIEAHYTFENGAVEVVSGIIGIDVFRSDSDRPCVFIDRGGSVLPGRKPTSERVGYDPIEGVIIPRED